MLLPRRTTVLGAGALAGAVIAPPVAAADPSPGQGSARHVLLLSVDGLHQADLAWYVQNQPQSALASLVHRGVDHHSGTTQVGVPAIFGMNFQSVSTAQKLPTSGDQPGGYLADGVTPGPMLANALNLVDSQIAAFVDEIHSKGLDGNTTIILSAKHGQWSTDPATLTRIPDGLAQVFAGRAAPKYSGVPGPYNTSTPPRPADHPPLYPNRSLDADCRWGTSRTAVCIQTAGRLFDENTSPVNVGAFCREVLVIRSE